MPYQQALTGELLAAIEEHEIEPLVYEAAGQSIAWFNELTTVRDIVERLLDEAAASFENMRGLIGVPGTADASPQQRLP